MRLLRVCVVFIAAAILFGCASTPVPATGHLFKKDTRVQTGYSMLYIFRPQQPGIAHYWPEVYLNGTKIVGLKDGGYTSVLIKPGRYKITTITDDPKGRKSETDGEIVVEADTEYYLKYDTHYQYPPASSGSDMFGGSVGIVPFLVSEGLGMNEQQRNLKRELVYSRWVVLPKENGLAEIQYRRYITPYVKEIFP